MVETYNIYVYKYYGIVYFVDYVIFLVILYGLLFFSLFEIHDNLYNFLLVTLLFIFHINVNGLDKENFRFALVHSQMVILYS